MNEVMSMNSLFGVFLVGRFLDSYNLSFIGEVDIVHLYHFCMTREVQVIAHAKIRYQFQIVRFIRVENILN